MFGCRRLKGPLAPLVDSKNLLKLLRGPLEGPQYLRDVEQVLQAGHSKAEHPQWPLVLTTASHSLALSPYFHEQVDHLWSTYLGPSFDRLSTAQVCQIFFSFVSAGYREWSLLNPVYARLNQDYRGLRPGELGTTLLSLASACETPESQPLVLLSRLTMQLKAEAPQVSPEDWLTSLWSLAALDFWDPPLFQAGLSNLNLSSFEDVHQRRQLLQIYYSAHLNGSEIQDPLMAKVTDEVREDSKEEKSETAYGFYHVGPELDLGTDPYSRLKRQHLEGWGCTIREDDEIESLADESEH